MATLSPPVSPSSATTSLDDLLERYLYLLDEYTSLREQLSKDCSSGFLSLAQANFNAPSHVRRYGQDMYDERMRPTLKAEIRQDPERLTLCSRPVPTASRSKLKTRIKSTTSLSLEPTRKPLAPDEPTKAPTLEDLRTEQPTEPAFSDSHSSSATSQAETPSSPTQGPSPPPSKTSSPEPASKEAGDKLPKDPLLQFGLLVPPALRAAQSSFARGTREAVFELVRVEREMRELEGKMREARRNASVREDGEE